MKYQLWFACCHAVTPRHITPLFQKIHSARELYSCSETTLAKLNLLTEKELRFIEDSKRTFDLDYEWGRFCESGISLCSLEESDYPSRLRTIADPPYALFYKGRLPNESGISVAVVGARQRSDYGATIARQLAEQLGKYNIEVISGLAMGIDSDAHKGALDGGGRTYGVLGCGVDQIYPKSNQFLYKKILEGGGGILSEFPNKTAPLAINFPRRNRIISALSDYIVVVEAKEKSGSFITVDFALEQGKEVYAVPGRISDPLSKGCNRLISQGCSSVLCIDEFLSDIGISVAGDSFQKDQIENSLEKDERLLYSLIDFTPRNLGSFMKTCGFSITKTLCILENLKRMQLIREHPANFYVRVKI